MNTMDAKELAELSLAVAKAEGLFHPEIVDGVCYCWVAETGLEYSYKPYLDPAAILRLLNKIKPRILSIQQSEEGWWIEVLAIGPQFGPTFGIAVCKCVVAIAAARSESHAK